MWKSPVGKKWKDQSMIEHKALNISDQTESKFAHFLPSDRLPTEPFVTFANVWKRWLGSDSLIR
jgi:hypothetical protein